MATSTDITAAMSSAMTNVQGEATSMIGTVLPYALAIAGIVIVVTLGWKIFKKFTGRT